MLYLVTYQFRPPRLGSQKKLAETIQATPTLGWWHYMDYTWLIKTSETATDLYNRLHTCFSNNDSLVIAQITRFAQMQGWLPQEAWKWITDQQSTEMY